MRSFINQLLSFWILLTTLGAGEDAVEVTDDGDDMFGGEDDDGGEIEEDTETTEEGGETDDDDDDDSDSDEDEEDEDDDEDAESDDDDAVSEGDGGGEGVDPAIALSIARNWESQMEAAANVRAQDPLSTLKAANVSIPDDLRGKVKQLFEEEKDIEAIVEVLKNIAPTLFGAYDESRVAPLMDAATITARAQEVTRAVDSFDKEYPGARTPAINNKMAEKYNLYAQKYGWQAADLVPPSDYFVMAGGRLPAKAKGKTAKKRSTKADRMEKEKRRSLSATREPSRIARPKNTKGKGRKKSTDDEDVQATFNAVQSTRFDPFTM
jgi:hypothetical protein